MLTIGTIYSWGIFTQPLLAAFHWSLTTTTWAYAIANFSLATIGAALGGFWQDRVGPRRIGMAGVALWGFGNLLAGIGTERLGAPWLYISYGICGGVGAGMAYVTSLAVVSKWFPDRPGLAGGVVAGAFGLGAFVFSELVPRLTPFQAAATHASKVLAVGSSASASVLPYATVSPLAPSALSAADVHAVMDVFIVSGLVFLLVGLPAAWLFRNPPESYALHKVGASGSQPTSTDYPPSKALAMPQFYLLWLQLLANVIAGITIISNAVYILADLTKLPGASIAPLFGMVSIFNAVGRVFWGGISDRIGCNRTFAAMFALQAVTLLLLSHTHSLAPALTGISVVLLCCGGGFGTMPAYTAEILGARYAGRNYGLILSAWGFAALIGSILAARIKDLSGSFAGMMPIIALVLLVSLILPFITRKPASPTSELTPMRGSA
jgi:MFS transporter, OFA family, oxalate/formate antiporter